MADNFSRISPQSPSRHEQYGLESCVANTDAHVLGASEDGAAYVWDLVGGGVLQRLYGHAKAVTGVAAHPKEAKLVTTSLDGTACYWEGSYDA